MSTEIPETVNQWLKTIQHWLLPPTCIVCRRDSGTHRDFCVACEATLPRLTGACQRCALPLPVNYAGSALCGTCLVLPPPYTRLLAPYRYYPPLPTLIAAFKYHYRLALGRELATSTALHLRWQYRESRLPDLLVPVPLHRARLRQRGFNQSLELARWLSGALQIPVRHDLVARTRHTPQQAGLSAAGRRRNLRGAFRMKREFHFAPDTVVAIVDDVVTTGTTVGELARVLLRAGATEVHVWAIARTIV